MIILTITIKNVILLKVRIINFYFKLFFHFRFEKISSIINYVNSKLKYCFLGGLCLQVNTKI